MLKYIIETAPLGTRYVVAAKDPENGSVVQVFTLIFIVKSNAEYCYFGVGKL